MLMKSYKYRLYPTKAQIEKLEWTLDRCRELYNAALQERRDAWKMCQVSINFYNQDKQLPEIKEIRPEYKEIYAQVLKDVMHRVDKAYKAFFRRVKNGEKPGYPRFQAKSRYNSFTYPQMANRNGPTFQEGKLRLPKIGDIKIKLHRPMQGIAKTCSVKREGAQWFVTFSCEMETQHTQRSPYIDDAIGIDLGLYHFAALSSGDTIENPRYYRKTEKKLAKLQQALSRKKRGSVRRKKAVQRMAKHHRKIRNQRTNFLHQWSRRLVNTYETIVFEDLATSDMSRAPKPKQENGKYLHNGAAVKAGLNKSILDAGWSTFITMCQYKAECAGTVQVMKVDPYKTSQICSACLHEGAHKDLSERTHTCEHCGIVLDRDVNAAINIKNVGLGTLNLRPASKQKKAQARTEPSGVTLRSLCAS